MTTVGLEVAFVNESEVPEVVSENPGAVPKTSIVQLKRDRGVAKGLLTKKRNEMESYIDKFESAAVVKIKLAELNSALERLEHAHTLYHEPLSDHEDIQDSLDYFNYEELKVKDLISRVQKCQISLAKEQPENPSTPVVAPSTPKVEPSTPVVKPLDQNDLQSLGPCQAPGQRLQPGKRNCSPRPTR